MHKIKPSREDAEKAQNLINTALEKAKERLPKDEEVVISLGWTEKEFIINQMDGTSGRAHDSNFFEINFNTKGDNWKSAIKTTSVHEYAHTWYYEKRFDSEGRNDKVWQYVVDEALTQNFAEAIFPDYEANQRRHISKEEIQKFWPEIREEELERDTAEISWPYELYINKGDSKYPNWLGYSMSYYIGKFFLNNGKDFEDFPEIEKEEVIRAGNKLFKED